MTSAIESRTVTGPVARSNWPSDNGLTCGSRVEQDALAEEVKADAAEHLAFALHTA
jgi:hypothetical protein